MLFPDSLNSQQKLFLQTILVINIADLRRFKQKSHILKGRKKCLEFGRKCYHFKNSNLVCEIGY